MSDLISRSALIKRRRKVVEYDEAGFSMDYFAVPVEEINNAPTVEAKPVEWIPCNERLPSVENMFYLICEKDGIILMCMWSAGGFNTFKNLNGTYYTDAKIRDVIAWMPLPNAYNAERGGKNE